MQNAKGRAEADLEVEPALVELAQVRKKLDEEAALLGSERVQPGRELIGRKQ